MARRRTATEQLATAVTGRATSPQGDASFQRAILKIALELKKPTARSYDAVVEETIRSMRLDPERFRRYLGANRAEAMGLLLAAARKFGP
jgi:hypothetical protein